jgi:hypothetical protein
MSDKITNGTQIGEGTEHVDPTPAAAAKPTPAPATPSPLLAAIDAWFHEHFNSLPIAWEATMRAHVQAAKEDLKARVAKL